MKNKLLALPFALSIVLGFSLSNQFLLSEEGSIAESAPVTYTPVASGYRPIISVPMLPESMKLEALSTGTADKFKKLAESSKAAPLVHLLSQKYSVSSEKARVVVASVFKYAAHYKVDPHILFGLIKVESGFNSKAVSEAGALGLMQVVPSVHKKQVAQYGKKTDDLLDVEFNIKMGSEIFGQTLKRSGGNLPVALELYNGSYGMDTPYAGKVMRASSEFLIYTRQLKYDENLS